MHNFKKVLLVSITFLLMVGIMSLAIMEAYIHSEYAFDEDVRLRRDLAGKIDYIILGASYVQQGIIPAEVDKALGVNSYLLADGWQSIPMSRTLLETELARNPVKEVVLDVTFSTMTRTEDTDKFEGDLYALTRLENTAQRLAYIRRTFEPKGYKRIFISYMQYGSEYLFKKALGKNVKNVIDENKGFKNMKSRDMRIKPENIEKYHKSKSFSNNWRKQNTEGLADIIKLCKSKGIKVSIIVMPVSQQKIWHYDGWDGFQKQLREYCIYNDVTLVDFNLLKERFDLLDEATSFANQEHLCTKGAKEFTPVFCRIMKQINEGEDVSDQFFDSYEEVEQLTMYAEFMSNK